ncbi:hypothetical protein PGT21_019940 [Puccinia graminis f. sp. tritici]|uniref:Zn(2)-C6 fungal-type domain-containing protein n=1 Tax=Puccinia graminis f. sp. tritici TaxID=56615 RepID=A0A5B0NUV2_PUCGR|nr:hypothetical protein PGT21_019940 [Puccinia graminis f. sp. tritici]KAA1115690.1 hypothetical protein PGTUg99_025805 [Puccinia graminis f. sp. tritici]
MRDQSGMSTSGNQPVEDKPKRRRYRIPRSCDRCRQSKVKCVFEDDQCNNCARLGVTCTFANPGSLKERPPTVKDIEQLTARIRSLERLLHAVEPTLDLNNLPNPNRLGSHSHGAPEILIQPHVVSTSPSEPDPAQTSGQDDYRSQLSAVLTGIHGLQITSKPPVTHIDWTRSDKTQAMSACTGAATLPDQYIGPNSALSIAEPAAYGIPLSSWELCERYPVDEYLRLRHEQYVSSAQAFYPEPDLEEALIKIYFQNFHPFVPVIHPTTFHGLHKSGFAETNSTFRALCLLIFSIASRWSCDPRVQLDLTGKPQPSRKFAGMRFTYAGFISLLQPGYDRTTLIHLQAFVLLTIASLGAFQPTITWICVEKGLILAQECGAHREAHKLWNADPLQDYLRRQAFFQLYEMAHRTSNSLHRAPLVEHDDFDLQPMHVQYGDPLGVFVNPYSSISRAVHQACIAFDEVRVLLLQLGSLRSMLPLLLKMQATTKGPGGASSIKSLKALVDQLDLNASRWFNKVPPIFKRADGEGAAEMLIFSVLAITCYQKFQLIIHQTLFNYQEYGQDGKATRTNPHIERCVEFAISSIQAMNKLRLRRLLTCGFYWLPGDLILTVVLLACSIRKQRRSISPHENQVRRDNILLAIAILDDLAPENHIAAAYSKMSKIMFGLLDDENPSILDSLTSSLKGNQYESHHSPSLSPPTHFPSVSTGSLVRSSESLAHGKSHLPVDDPELQDCARKEAWDPLEFSAATYDTAAVNHPLSTSPPSLPIYPPAHLTWSHPTTNTPQQ